jgi:BirA family biotin operon repressor/biotin-[acetyl-CoA-carboxylase] ligase
MKTLFVGQNSFHIESLDSTNSYASEMLRQIAPVDGTLIYTFRQLSGRGQRGNSWESEPNRNVALSLILHPRFLAPDQQYFLTKVASLAVSDVMAEMLGASTRRVTIKWPNDIYVNDHKIAGILIENTLKERVIHSSVIGIGINVNQVLFNDAPNATSLMMLTGKEFSLPGIVDRICERAEAYYLQLRSGKYRELSELYLSRLYRKDEWANFRSGEEIFLGKITGVSAGGKLQLERQNGGPAEYDLKEIAFAG